MAGCNLVQGIGATTYENMPINPKYFTQLSISETICIPNEKPDIKELISVTIDNSVISKKLIKTAIGTSNEGQILTGFKLIIELKLRQKLKYIADEPRQSVYSAHFEKKINSIFIVVPATVMIDTQIIPIEDLFSQNRLMTTPYVEDIHAAAQGKRCLFKNISMLVDVKVI